MSLSSPTQTDTSDVYPPISIILTPPPGSKEPEINLTETFKTLFSDYDSYQKTAFRNLKQAQEAEARATKTLQLVSQKKSEAEEVLRFQAGLQQRFATSLRDSAVVLEKEMQATRQEFHRLCGRKIKGLRSEIN